jgi:hypothetical protein
MAMPPPVSKLDVEEGLTLPAGRLLPQADGFEGLLAGGELLNPHGEAVAHVV